MFRPRPRQRSSRPLGITKKLKKLLSNKLQEANNKGTNKHTNNMVRHVERGMEEWSELMEESKTKFVVVDFAASWCPPCRMIGPIFEKLSQEYPNAEFVKVDVDEQKEIAEACGVSGLPTFQFYQGGEKVFQMCGADPDGLKELLEWMELMEESKTKLVVVDFTASWCPPCRMMGPIFEKLSEETPNAKFVKVDVDEKGGIAGMCGISGMPTFQFYKGGNVVAEMCGADPDGLKELIAEHA